MLYKYDEVDIRDGMIDVNGEVSLDATVFVSEGGIFKGKVADHGTLIIRGGSADVVIGRYGTVLAHGGVLHVVVQQDGTLHVHEGRVTIKEEGGFVQANESTSYITYEPSELKNMRFDRYTTIHGVTKAVNCTVTKTGMVTVYPGGMFLGVGKFALIQGKVCCGGILQNIHVGENGHLTCTDNSILKHCVIGAKGKVSISSAHGAQGIIVNKNGVLEVLDDAEATCVTLEYKGRLITYCGSYVSIRDHGGTIERHGGKVVRAKVKR